MAKNYIPVQWLNKNVAFRSVFKLASQVQKIPSLLCLAFVGLGVVACTPSPEACIHASKSVVNLGETVTFENCSEDYKTYIVSFGDGSQIDSKTDGEIAHTYDVPGTYTVELMAFAKENKAGVSATTAITVNEPNKQKMMGEWHHYRDVGYTIFRFEGNVDTVKIGHKNDFRWSIYSNGEGKRGYRGLVFNFTWQLLDNARLVYSKVDTFHVVAQSDSTMVWRLYDEPDVFTHYQFRRLP